ncbi:MAG: DoxX family protein [Chloroflexi bacterium]|nr:MAG: DoxX family protein [Chloroflexota bacterium]
MSTAASAILFVGRLLFVGLFMSTAVNHIRSRDRYVAIAKGRIPIPYVAGWPAGVWLLLADASLVLGVWPDIGTLMLAAFLVPITILFHPFWAISDPAQRRTQEMNFYRNVSLVGAALALFALFSVVGPGRFAITGSLLNLR